MTKHAACPMLLVALLAGCPPQQGKKTAGEVETAKTAKTKETTGTGGTAKTEEAAPEPEPEETVKDEGKKTHARPTTERPVAIISKREVKPPEYDEFFRRKLHKTPAIERDLHEKPIIEGDIHEPPEAEAKEELPAVELRIRAGHPGRADLVSAFRGWQTKYSKRARFRLGDCGAGAVAGVNLPGEGCRSPGHVRLRLRAGEGGAVVRMGRFDFNEPGSLDDSTWKHLREKLTEAKHRYTGMSPFGVPFIIEAEDGVPAKVIARTVTEALAVLYGR